MRSGSEWWAAMSEWRWGATRAARYVPQMHCLGSRRVKKLRKSSYLEPLRSLS